MTTRELVELLPVYNYHVSVWRSDAMGDIWRLGAPAASGPQIPRYLLGVLERQPKILVMRRPKYAIYRVFPPKKGSKDND